MDRTSDTIYSYPTSDEPRQVEAPISKDDYVADDQPIHAEDVTAAKSSPEAS